MDTGCDRRSTRHGVRCVVLCALSSPFFSAPVYTIRYVWAHQPMSYSREVNAGASTVQHLLSAVLVFIFSSQKGVQQHLSFVDREVDNCVALTTSRSSLLGPMSEKIADCGTAQKIGPTTQP